MSADEHAERIYGAIDAMVTDPELPDAKTVSLLRDVSAACATSADSIEAS